MWSIQALPSIPDQKFRGCWTHTHQRKDQLCTRNKVIHTYFEDHYGDKPFFLKIKYIDRQIQEIKCQFLFFRQKTWIHFQQSEFSQRIFRARTGGSSWGLAGSGCQERSLGYFAGKLTRPTHHALVSELVLPFLLPLWSYYFCLFLHLCTHINF